LRQVLENFLEEKDGNEIVKAEDFFLAFKDVDGLQLDKKEVVSKFGHFNIIDDGSPRKY